MAATTVWWRPGASGLPRASRWSYAFSISRGGLRALIAQYRPDMAAVEEVFFAVNAKSALKLSHVRGVALLLMAEASIAFAEYSPLEVKKSVVGYGRAEKTQVQQMVASLLRLAAPLESEDASDALAIAICHATQAPYLALEARA